MMSLPCDAARPSGVVQSAMLTATNLLAVKVAATPADNYGR